MTRGDAKDLWQPDELLCQKASGWKLPVNVRYLADWSQIGKIRFLKTHIHTQREREREREKERKRERENKGESERQTDTQTCAHTHTHKHWHEKKN